VYLLGEDLTAAPDVRPFSLGSLLTKFIHVAAYLSPLLPSVFDVHADSRALSYHESSLISFGKQLWKSDWAASTDAVPYDMTFEAADHREEYLEGRPHPNTFYQSHVSRMVKQLTLVLEKRKRFVRQAHERLILDVSNEVFFKRPVPLPLA
jgi:hypothetical protein